MFDRFKQAGFIYNYPEDEVKEAVRFHVKLRYSDWMSKLRNSVFTKYHTIEDRKNHCPSCVKPSDWKLMVDKWSTEEWMVNRFCYVFFNSYIYFII